MKVLMPDAEQILAGLAELANRWRGLALAWHVYFAFLAAWRIIWARPSRRLTGILLGLPVLSPSALAWLAGNWFNGMILGLAGVALLAIAVTLPRSPIRPPTLRTVVPGLLLAAFGWTYPHFLETASYLPYLYVAPTGVVPCATLSIVVGFALTAGGLDSRPWSLVLGATGIFYGLYGAVVLAVTIDWVLVVGAAMLMAAVWTIGRPGAAPETA